MLKVIRIFFALFAPLFLLGDPPAEDACGYIFDAYPPLYVPASIHSMVGVSPLGDSIELEDGSIWEICRYDGYKAMYWRSNDPITITQNHRWFSNYNYRIINQTTGEYLEANLFFGPLEYGEHTLYIAGIDGVTGNLVVVTGFGESICWEIAPSDIALFQNWALHDPIIIGQNSGWDTEYEALLINVSMNHSVRARQN